MTIGNTTEIMICEVCKGWVIMVMVFLLTGVSDDLDEKIREEHGIEEALHEFIFTPDEVGYWLLLASVAALSWVSVVRMSVLYYCGFDSNIFYETYLGVKQMEEKRSLKEQYYSAPSAVWRIGHLSSKDYGFIDPNDYITATYEIMTLMTIVGWGLTISFRPDIIHSNPLKDRMGYNHICVGFDATPANEVCAIMWIFSIYYLFRWLNFDMEASMHKELYNSTESWAVSATKSFLKFSHGFLALTSCGFMLCFIIHPEESIWGHTLPFCFYIIGRLMVFYARLVEMKVEGKEITTGTLLYALVYTALSLAYNGMMIGTIYKYQNENRTGFDPPFHIGWWIWIDWGWILVQGVEKRMFPKLPIISTKRVEITSFEKEIIKTNGGTTGDTSVALLSEGKQGILMNYME